MKSFGVVILGTDEDQRTVLQMQVDATGVGRTMHAFSSHPVAATDPIIRRIQEFRPDIILVDIPKSTPAPALQGIQLLHMEVPDALILGVGETAQSQTIIGAMRAGAREYLERPTSTTSLLEAFVRLTSSAKKHRQQNSVGKVLTFVNAKGGCGATTIAVNTAVALQKQSGNVVLLDLAPLGHAAVQLNQKPSFTVADALRNAARLDASLLDVYVARYSNGLHLLAGVTEPLPVDTPTSDVARLLDALVGQYSYVVVDGSARLDPLMRVVCDLSHSVGLVSTADVAALWSAAKVQSYLSGGAAAGKIRLVLNRFRKIPGFSDSEIEAATMTKLMAKIPNQYAAVSAGIDRGVPAVEQNNSEIARAFSGLASALTAEKVETKRSTFSLFAAESHA